MFDNLLKILLGFCVLFTIIILGAILIMVMGKVLPVVKIIISDHALSIEETENIWLTCKIIFFGGLSILIIVLLHFIYELLQIWRINLKEKYLKNKEIELEQQKFNINILMRAINDTELRLQKKIKDIHDDTYNLTIRVHQAIHKLNTFRDSIANAFRELIKAIDLNFKFILEQLKDRSAGFWGIIQFIFDNQIKELASFSQLEKIIFFFATLWILVISISLKDEHQKFEKVILRIVLGYMPIWFFFFYRLYLNRLNLTIFNIFDYICYGTSFIIFILLMNETFKLKKQRPYRSLKFEDFFKGY